MRVRGIVLLLFVSAVVWLSTYAEAADEKGKASGSTTPVPISYTKIDQHALKADKAAEKSIPDLAAYLIKPAKDEREKVRAVFRWVTDRIAYDVNSLALSPKERPGDAPETLMTSRKGLCGGYSNLFVELCKEAGIEAVRVIGHGKGNNWKDGVRDTEKHAWNAVKIDGKWHLCDLTWSAGSVNEKGFFKGFDDLYFCTSAELFVFTHLPDKKEWQLLDPAVSEDDYYKWPKIERELFRFGIAAEELKTVVTQKEFSGLVATYAQEGAKIHLLKAPLTAKLKEGVKYSIQLEAPDYQDIAWLRGDKKPESLTKKGNVYEYSGSFKKGKITLVGLVPGKGPTRSYRWILEYTVE